jgi:hypothetical protein
MRERSSSPLRRSTTRPRPASVSGVTASLFQTGSTARRESLSGTCLQELDQVEPCSTKLPSMTHQSTRVLSASGWQRCQLVLTLPQTPMTKSCAETQPIRAETQSIRTAVQRFQGRTLMKSTRRHQLWPALERHFCWPQCARAAVRSSSQRGRMTRRSRRNSFTQFTHSIPSNSIHWHTPTSG